MVLDAPEAGILTFHPCLFASVAFGDSAVVASQDAGELHLGGYDASAALTRQCPLSSDTLACTNLPCMAIKHGEALQSTLAQEEILFFDCHPSPSPAGFTHVSILRVSGHCTNVQYLLPARSRDRSSCRFSMHRPLASFISIVWYPFESTDLSHDSSFQTNSSHHRFSRSILPDTQFVWPEPLHRKGQGHAIWFAGNPLFRRRWCGLDGRNLRYWQ